MILALKSARPEVSPQDKVKLTHYSGGLKRITSAVIERDIGHDQPLTRREERLEEEIAVSL